MLVAQVFSLCYHICFVFTNLEGPQARFRIRLFFQLQIAELIKVICVTENDSWQFLSYF